MSASCYRQSIDSYAGLNASIVSKLFLVQSSYFVINIDIILVCKKVMKQKILFIILIE